MTGALAREACPEKQLFDIFLCEISLIIEKLYEIDGSGTHSHNPQLNPNFHSHNTLFKPSSLS